MSKDNPAPLTAADARWIARVLFAVDAEGYEPKFSSMRIGQHWGVIDCEGDTLIGYMDEPAAIQIASALNRLAEY